MLATLRQDVRIAASATGTSVGAALLALDRPKGPETQKITPHPDKRLNRYAREWKRKVNAS